MVVKEKGTGYFLLDRADSHLKCNRTGKKKDIEGMVP